MSDCCCSSQKLRLDLGLYIPQIKSKGRYEVNGQVLLLPIVSHGEFWAEFSKIGFLNVNNTFMDILTLQMTSMRLQKCTESKSSRMASRT